MNGLFKLSKPVIRQCGRLLDADAAGVGCELNADGDGVSFSIISESDMDDVQISFSIVLDAGWKSYVITPGTMYNGNRFLVSPQPYCPNIPTEGVSPDGPILCTDVPRLTSDTGYRVEFAANAFTIPAVGVYDSAKGLGYLIGLDVYGEWGTTGVNITTLPGEPVTIEICLPVRRKKRYHFCDWIDANEKGMSLKPGECLAGKVSVRRAKLNTIPELISLIAEYGYERRGTEQRREPISFAKAAELIEDKLDKYNWSEPHGYYTESGRSANDRKGFYIMQTGFAGGGSTIRALAHSENQERRKRALKMMDTICRNALTPSGYFHGVHTGEKWVSFGLKRPGCRAASFIRRPLECTRDILRTFELLKSRGEAVIDVWEHAAKSNLDAMVDTTRRYGHIGHTVDFDNGNVLWGGSACGAFGIEPLVCGADWFKNDDYLKTAIVLAEHYVEHFLRKGYTCGGNGDTLMAVDSESSYALMAGLFYLSERTQDEKHLEWARQAADLFSTWVLCYDAELPEDSPLGKLGVQPRGAVWADIQNQHGAPGICTSSGIELLKLSERTGIERYRWLAMNIAQCIPQMVVRPGQEDIWGDLPVGSVSERLMTMDGMEPCGYTSAISTWSEIAMLISAAELPAEFDAFSE